MENAIKYSLIAGAGFIAGIVISSMAIKDALSDFSYLPACSEELTKHMECPVYLFADSHYIK